MIQLKYSYPHPSIVLESTYEKIFVVPCSTGKLKNAYDCNGKLYPEYLEGKKSEGFLQKTILILNDAKWISKSRVIRAFGRKVTPIFFQSLKDSTFALSFKSHNHEFKNLQNIINSQNSKIDEMKAEMERIKDTHSLLANEYNDIIEENKQLKKNISLSLVDN